jgi:hypothetical protein
MREKRVIVTNEKKRETQNRTQEREEEKDGIESKECHDKRHRGAECDKITCIPIMA